MTENNIKNLLFDLGGVIMNLDRARCVEAFRALGLKDPEEFLGEYGQKGPFGALESGAISADEFRNEVRTLIGRPEVTDEEIDRAFCAFLTGIPEYRLDALRALRGKYKVYLLSNTNTIMWDSDIKKEFAQQGVDINHYFDGTVTSFDAKSLKPNAEIFNYTAQKLGIDPAETLFLDDSQANCNAARALGWNTALVEPGAEFVSILAKRGITPWA